MSPSSQSQIMALPSAHAEYQSVIYLCIVTTLCGFEVGMLWVPRHDEPKNTVAHRKRTRGSCQGSCKWAQAEQSNDQASNTVASDRGSSTPGLPDRFDRVLIADRSQQETRNTLSFRTFSIENDCHLTPEPNASRWPARGINTATPHRVESPSVSFVPPPGVNRRGGWLDVP
jgi:hypothetical protein